MTDPVPAPEPQPAADPAPEPAPQPPAPEPKPDPAPEPAAQQAPAGNTVNAHKHQREVQKLQEQLDAANKELEGYKGLDKKLSDFMAKQEADATGRALKEAGCIDTVAASARMSEFDGDIAKLKEAAPYLFASKDNSKSTGGNPKGAPDPEDERTKRMRTIMGLDSDKE